MNVKAIIKITHTDLLFSYDNLDKFKEDLVYYLDKVNFFVCIFTYDKIYERVANEILLEYVEKHFAINY